MNAIFASESDIVITHRVDDVQGYMAPDVQKRSPHFHYLYEMLIVLDGTACFCICDKHYQVSRGSILCIGNMENHYIVSYSKGFSRYAIRFSANALHTLIHNSQLLSVFMQRTSDFCHHYQCNSEELKFYQQLCQKMLVEFSCRKPCWDLCMGSLMQDILINMYRMQKNYFPSYLRTDVQRLVFDIQNYIETHLQEDLSLDFIAQKFYISKYYLSHCFRDIAGHTFKQHVILARISKAKDILLTTNIPISKISGLVGFQSTSHFIRIFKKYEHVSPLQYRNQGRNLS